MKLTLLRLTPQGEHERSPTTRRRILKVRITRFVRIFLVFAGCGIAATIVLVFLGNWPTAEILLTKAFDSLAEALAESVAD